MFVCLFVYKYSVALMFDAKDDTGLFFVGGGVFLLLCVFCVCVCVFLGEV